MATRSKKILIGCGVGCAGLLVLGIGSCIGFTSWIGRPGELIEPERLLGPQTTGFVEWTLRMEDPGTEQIAQRLVELSRTDADELGTELPSWARRLIASSQSSNNEKLINELLPAVVAWSARSGETPDDDLHLFTVGVAGFGNRIVFLDWLLGRLLPMDGDVVVVRHAGERIYEFPVNDRRRETGPQRMALFLRKAGLFIASDAQTARDAVDRLVAEESAGTHAPTEIERQFDGIPASFPLRGAISNERGELGRVWSLMADGHEEELSGIRMATVRAEFVDGSDLAGTLELDCEDAEWAAENSERLLGLLDRRTEFDSTIAGIDGANVRIEFRIRDLLSYLD